MILNLELKISFWRWIQTEKVWSFTVTFYIYFLSTISDNVRYTSHTTIIISYSFRTWRAASPLMPAKPPDHCLLEKIANRHYPEQRWFVKLPIVFLQKVKKSKISLGVISNLKFQMTILYTSSLAIFLAGIKQTL